MVDNQSDQNNDLKHT